MSKIIFFALVAAFAVLVAAEAEEASAVDIHPYSVQICAEELNQPKLRAASNLISDIGSVATELDDPEAKGIVDRFVTEAIQLDSERYNPLGYKWAKMQKKMKALLAAKPAARDVHHLFHKSAAHHGLTRMEMKYMRLFKKYQRLHQAYKKGCVRNRFWLRLNKWHWRVLMASDKRLRKLVHAYARLRRRDQRTTAQFKSKLQWTNKAGYKTVRFFKHVIALSHHAIKVSKHKAARVLSRNMRLKIAAKRLAKKMALLKKGIISRRQQDLDMDDDEDEDEQHEENVEDDLNNYDDWE